MYTHRLITILIALLAFSTFIDAQNEVDSVAVPQAKAQAKREGVELVAVKDSIALAVEDSLAMIADSIADLVQIETAKLSKDDGVAQAEVSISVDVDKVAGHFVPDSKKAMWMAIVLPGGGQIYNRKYWKLPIIYGGFLGCAYALTWNNTMYRDYSQAYIDIMDSDPNTKSYMNFVPANYDVEANMSRLQDLFRKKKDFYRRYRDMSVFCMIGVYALSIVDAYVDAELSSFDISPDLSMKVHPTIINDRHTALRASGMSGQSYGLQCSFSF